MVYLDLIFNLSLLVALSVVSGLFDKRFSRETRTGSLLQGLLFGTVAVLGMLRPLVLGPGLIFDGRSVMVSLCALFFGPWAAVAAFILPAACRIILGGVGTLTGVLVTFSSVSIGLLAHFHKQRQTDTLTLSHLYLFGVAVHLAMLALMFTLPGGKGLSVVQKIGLPVILLYPLATILVGKILADQLYTIQAANLIRESEERYRSLFEESLDAILFAAPDGRIFEANPAACRLFERSEEELQKLGRDAFRDPTDPRWVSFITERAQTGKFRGDLTFIRKTGSTFQGEIATVIFQDRQGMPCLCTLIRDISTRKQWEETLKETEQKFRTIFDFASDGILIARVADRKFVLANHKICEMLGYTEAELLQLGMPDIHPSEVLPEIMDIFSRLAARKMITTKDIPLMRKDKTILYAEISASPVMLAGENCLLGLFRDVTERRQAEEALVISEKRLKEAQTIARIGSWEFDPVTNNHYWSEEMFHLFEFDPAAGVPSFDDYLQMIHPEDRNRIRNSFLQGISGQKSYSDQYRVVYPDGRIRWIEATSSPIFDGHDKMVKYTGTAQDISERKQAEREIRRLNEELEQRVNERTAELQEAVARLEELNRVFVGRELKMVDLKTRIQELEKRGHKD